jgi:hypothetical protein
VSLNYNKVYGWIDFDSISPEYISKNFDAEWKKQSSKFPMDLPNMKKLYEAVDVIGLSGRHTPPASTQAWASCPQPANAPSIVFSIYPSTPLNQELQLEPAVTFVRC